jgi:broad specificity phosphatase PhoE
MKTIYLVRHGEAEINPTAEKKPIHVKGAHAELTPRGFIQAEKVAERAANLPIQAIIASTMLRAQQTAGIVSKRINIPLESSDLFTERREPTSLIGLIWDDPETQRRFRAWEKTFLHDGKEEDGENFEDVNRRAAGALMFLEGRAEENVLVITHGYFMRVLLGRILFADKNSRDLVMALEHGMRTANTGLTILNHDVTDARSPWRLMTWNDHVHLADA